APPSIILDENGTSAGLGPSITPPTSAASAALLDNLAIDDEEIGPGAVYGLETDFAEREAVDQRHVDRGQCFRHERHGVSGGAQKRVDARLAQAERILQNGKRQTAWTRRLD